jgi:diaminopimelate decarboxylase
LKKYFSQETNYYENSNPKELINSFGSPLYVYNEKILRQRCRDMANLISYPNFKVNYSTKANSNLSLLKIIREEGLVADAMSPGEIYVLLKAGFTPDEIFYISNNVSKEEMLYAIEKGIITSVDSISQLELYGKLNPGGKVAVRFNPGVGAGHHEKVVTGGKKTKFGVNMNLIDDVKALLKKYNLTLVGVNQHIGSLFMEADSYLEGVKTILSIAENFDTLEFVDFGGGFGIPYKKQDGEERLNLKDLGKKLDAVLFDWSKKYGKEIMFKIEPGRYIAAECCILLGKVYSIKNNYNRKYAGTDLGFNVLARPIMYDSHHDIEVYRDGKLLMNCEKENFFVVGNICESGDIIAKDRFLPIIEEDDIIGVTDSGAYGFVMTSNYNNRLKPAEVIIKENGNVKLIRKRDTLEDLINKF